MKDGHCTTRSVRMLGGGSDIASATVKAMPRGPLRRVTPPARTSPPSASQGVSTLVFDASATTTQCLPGDPQDRREAGLSCTALELMTDD